MITDELRKIRTDEVTEFSKLYADCVKMAEDAEEPLSKPRIVGRQTLRSNVEAESWRVLQEIHIPAIPWSLSWKTAFAGRSRDTIKALYLLPKNLGKLEDDTVEKILSCYESDLPSSVDFKQELRLWRRFWSSRDGDELPSTVSDVLQKISADGVQLLYPNITSIFGIVLTSLRRLLVWNAQIPHYASQKHRIVLRCVNSDSMHWSSYLSTGILYLTM